MNKIEKLLSRYPKLPESFLRLFAIYCARDALSVLSDVLLSDVLKAIEVAEQYALGKATEAELDIYAQLCKVRYYADPRIFVNTTQWAMGHFIARRPLDIPIVYSGTQVIFENMDIEAKEYAQELQRRIDNLSALEKLVYDI